MEIILIDDGSTDNSGLICDLYSKRDKRIVVVHKKNEGVSVARNLGVESSHGEYIGFVDSDDFIAKNMFSVLFSAIQRDESDMACCNYLQIDENGTALQGQRLPIKNECINMEKALKCLILWGGYYVVPVNKLYKSYIFKSLKFPYGKRYEDLYIIPQIIAQCTKISHVEESLYFYVRHSESFTLGEFNVHEFDFVDAMINIYCFARKYCYKELKNYCVQRISYKLEEYWKELKKHPEFKRRYFMVKKKTLFLIFEREAWKDYSIKGKIWKRIYFLFF